MKLKLPSLKLPRFKMPALRRTAPPPSRSPRLMRATARRAQPQAFDDYEHEEPTTRLSSAFIVVLVLHLVAIGGIVAFNGIKAHRHSQEILAGPAPVKPAVAKPDAAANSDASYAASATPAPVHMQNTAPAPVSGARVHHVKAGESLVKIAFAYSVTPAELAAANSLKETSSVRPGQILNIPVPHAVTKPVTTTSKNLADQQTLRSQKTYTVGKGESPVAIARKLGVSYDELMKLNKIEDPKKLQIGQVLKVPVKAKPAESI